MKKCKVILALLGLIFGGQVTLATAQVSSSRQDLLLQAIKANPNDATAHFNLGVSYFNQQNYDLAIPEFQKCLQLNSNDQQAKELLESGLGISSYLKHDLSAAIDHFQKTLKINPKNPNANLLLGDSYLQLKQYEHAETALENYAANFPGDKEVQAKANFGLSKIFMDQKQYKQAIEVLTKVVSTDSGNFEALQNLAVAYFQSKDFQDAASYWEKAANLRKDARTYKFIGFSYYNLGNFNKAIDNYKKSIQIELQKDIKEQDVESLDDTYYNLAVAYDDNALYDDAADNFAQAFKNNPKDSNAAVGQAHAVDLAVNAHMEKASNFLLNNQYSDAISEWQKVLKYQPDNLQAKNFITDAQSKLNIEVDKHDAAGKALNQKGDTLGALREWNMALEMNPNDEKVRGEMKHLNVKTTEEVKSLLVDGDESYAAQDYAGALDKYLRAKKINPKSAQVKARLKKMNKQIQGIFDRAKSYYAKGSLNKALVYLLQAKQIDQNNIDINGLLFKVQKDISVKVKNLDADGIELFNGNNKEQAKLKFQDAISLRPNDETANDYVKKMTGQQSQAKMDAEKEKELYYEGVNLYINGKIREAIKKWQECLAQDPNNINAKNNIEKANVKLQSIDKLSNS